MVCKEYIIVLLLNAIIVTSATVTLLYPKGFSISVGDEGRIKNVHFDINVTRNGGNSIIASYSKNVHQFFGHRFTFTRDNVVLNVGDVISYKIVSNVNNSTQKLEDGVCCVRELPKKGALRKHGWLFNYDIALTDSECGRGNGTNANPKSVAIGARVNVPEEDLNLRLSKCEQAAFNTSLLLLTLQLEVEELRNLTKQIKEFEEAYPLAKQLTLSGRIPPDGDAVETVQFIIDEKLDLKPTIVSAFRDSPYNIRFTVSTIIEKFQILEAAKFILPDTKIEIS